MALTANFDTPKTASGQYISVIGTVAASGILDLGLVVSVSRYDAAAVTNYYLTKIYDNSANTSASAISESLIIAIIPAIVGAESAYSVTTLNAFEGDILIS